MAKDWTEGLYLRADGVYEKVKTVKGARYPFRSRDPKEVWKQYLNFEERQQKGPLFPDIADEWYALNEKDWRPGTIKTYKPITKRCKEYFANQRITELEAPDIKNFLLWLKSHGYFEKTVKNHLSVVNMIFVHSITCDDHWRKDNPAEYVKIPIDLPKKKRKPPTEEQVKKIKSGLQNQYGLLAAFFLYSGARLGETLAIQGKHLGDRIIVEQELVWDSSGRPSVMPYAKTEAGERDIGMLAPLKALLPKIKPNQYLFGDDKPWTKSQCSYRWRMWCRSVGLAHPEKRLEKRKNGKEYEMTIWKADVTPHQLRHEYASKCFEAGVDEKVAAQMFGHSDSSTMRQIYQSIRSRQIEDATKKMNALEEKK